MASAQPITQFPALPADLGAPCNLFYICRRGGWTAMSAKRRVAHIRNLVDGHGFPAPYPARLRGGTTAAVVADSTWPRLAVDMWFDGFVPPAAIAAEDAAARHAAALDMDSAAFGLRLVAGARA